MAGGEIGYYTLPVIVSFKGIDAQVEAKLGKSIQDLGKKTGEDFGTAVVTGLDPTKSPKVNNAIKSSSGVGKKMGDAITTEVVKNIDGKKVSDKITTDVQNAAKGDAGKKMGDAVSTNVAKNFDPKVLGKRIEEGLAKAQNLDTKKIGKQIEDGLAGGIDAKAIGGALKDFLKQPMAEATQVAKEWGNQVGKEILAGDIKGAAKDVDTVIKNTTGSINNLGKLVGVNLDSVEQFGTTAVTKIDSLANTAQNVVDKITGTVTDVKATRDAIKSLTSGDTTSRLRGVSTLLDTVNTSASRFGVDASGVTKPVQDAVETATDVADTVTTLRTLVPAGTGAKVGALGARGLAGLGVGEEAVAGIGTAVGAALGPALAAAAILAGGKYLQDHVEEFFPPDARLKHGEINYGPTGAPVSTPEQQQQGYDAAAAQPKPPRPPRPGYSWQRDMGRGGIWVEVPYSGPGFGVPGAGEPGAPPPAPPPEAAPDDELAALNAARAARGQPPLRAAGQPAPPPPPPPAPAPAPVYGPYRVAQPAPMPAVAPPMEPGPPGRPLQPYGDTSKMEPGLGKFAATLGNMAVQAMAVQASSATVNAGSVNVNGAAVGGGASSLSRPGFKSWYQTGGGITGPGGVDQVPILATAGEHMLTVDDVNALGGQAGVYDFRRSLHGLNGGGPPPPPPRWQPRRPIIPNRAAIKGVYRGGAILGYDDGGEIRDAVGAIAPAVAAAAAEGAAKGAAAGGGGGGGSPLQAFSGGAGGQGQQDSLQFLSGMLGVAGQGAGEELGLGTVFPDPMANPNVKSIMGLFSALSGPIKGAMAGKLGIQQPGWRPGMPVAAMANNQQPAGSIGLPFGLPSIDIPPAPAPGPPEAPGGAPGGGPGGSTFNVDASINYHDGSVLGVDPAAQRATDTRTQERNLANTVAPVDPGNH